MVLKYFSVKQVFSDLDFVGWYTTGDAPTEIDISVHKQVRTRILMIEMDFFLYLVPRYSLLLFKKLLQCIVYLFKNFNLFWMIHNYFYFMSFTHLFLCQLTLWHHCGICVRIRMNNFSKTTRIRDMLFFKRYFNYQG